MDNKGVYINAFNYLNNLYDDTSKLFENIENQFYEFKYELNNSSPFTHNIGYKTNNWYIKYLNYWFLKKEKRVSEVIVVLVDFNSYSETYKFPKVLCGKTIQSKIDENKFNLWNHKYFNDIIIDHNKCWKMTKNENNWTFFSPLSNKIQPGVSLFKCYFLNLFDLNDSEIVNKYIIKPLVDDVFDNSKKIKIYNFN